MPILLLFAPLLKSRFFVIYFRCETLAEAKPPSDEGGVFCHRQKTEGLAIPQSALQTAPFTQGSLFCILPIHALLYGAKARTFYGQDSFRLPWQDFPEFLKTLVPLRKIAFQNYIYQQFTNETGEPNLQ